VARGHDTPGRDAWPGGVTLVLTRLTAEPHGTQVETIRACAAAAFMRVLSQAI
jgi:hypothetical protein